MSSGVVALVVARDRQAHLDSVLLAAASQTLQPNHILLLDCSEEATLKTPGNLDVRSVPTPGAANLGAAIQQLRDSSPELAAARWWWILHDDSIPEPSCLRALWEVADRGRTIGFVGAKQMSMDGTQLLELGIHATRSARRLERISPGEIDQGQYDSTSDVLAAGTAGALIRPEAWDAVGGIDPVLGPFGDGLDFGRRLHLAGYRVVVAPKARIRHARLALFPQGHEKEALRSGGEEDNSDLPLLNAAKSHPAHDPQDASFAARRFAQIYNWAKATPAPLLPLLMLWLAIWSPIRAFGRLSSGASHLAGAELCAWAQALRKTPALFKARRIQARASKVPTKALRGLESSGRELRERRRDLAKALAPEDENVDPLLIESARAHRVKSRRILLLVLLFTALLALGRWWGMNGTLAGGAWRALPASGQGLWESTWSNWVPGGDGRIGVADPLLIVLALFAYPLSLLGITPTSFARYLLFLLAPLAAASAWRFSSRLTSSPALRGAGALAWSVLPALTLSQSQGRLAPALFHVLVPLAASAWLSLAAPRTPLRLEGARGTIDAPENLRSGALARFTVVGAAMVACVPWAILPLMIALIILWRRGSARWGALAAFMPAALLIAPTIFSAFRFFAWRALLSPSGPDAPSLEPVAWQALLGLPTQISRVEVLALSLIPGALLLLAALFAILLSPHERGRGLPLVICCTALALSGGAALSRCDVGVEGTQVLTAWSAPAVSIGSLGLIGLALKAAPSSPAWNSKAMRPFSFLAALASLLFLVSGTAPILERILEHDAQASASTSQRLASPTLSASTDLVSVVSAQAQASTRGGRVLVLDSDAEVSTLSLRLWRGQGPSFLDSTPITRAQDLRAQLHGDAMDPASSELAELALTLVVYPDEATVRSLADHGVDTILIRPESAGLKAMSDALDRAPGLEKVGDTDAGSLWRLHLDSMHTARARIIDGHTWTNLDSGALRVSGDLPEGSKGQIVLAERFDPGWKATLNAQPLEAFARGWSQAFTLEQASGDLLITHESIWALPWKILTLGALALAALLAIPWRRRA